jgi:hypothetical protein
MAFLYTFFNRMYLLKKYRLSQNAAIILAVKDGKKEL